MNTLEKLKNIEQQAINISKKMLLENKVYKEELEERLRLNLNGYDAIKHYNAWMKRYKMEHLMVNL